MVLQPFPRVSGRTKGDSPYSCWRRAPYRVAGVGGDPNVQLAVTPPFVGLEQRRHSVLVLAQGRSEREAGFRSCVSSQAGVRYLNLATFAMAESRSVAGARDDRRRAQ